MGEKPIRASGRVIGTILIDNPILLLPTPSRILPFSPLGEHTPEN